MIAQSFSQAPHPGRGGNAPAYPRLRYACRGQLAAALLGPELQASATPGCVALAGGYLQRPRWGREQSRCSAPAGAKISPILQTKLSDGYVAQCIEIDIASQGDTKAEALANLREAVDLFFECAPPEEVNERILLDLNRVHR